MSGFRKKSIQALRGIFSDWCSDCRHFAPSLAFYRLGGTIFRLLRIMPVAKWFWARKDRWILAYLRKKYGNAFSNIVPSPEAPADSVIWVCWLSGLETAPPLVRACVSSIYRNAGEHPVHLVTLDNYAEHVTLPDHILQKFRDGKIGMAHFSDILRVCLLAEHGGLWLDSTIFCKSPIPREWTSAPFFTCKSERQEIGCVSNNEWTTFCLGGWMGCPAFMALRAFFFRYWEEEERAIDYLFFDDAIALSVELTPGMAELLQSVPLNNEKRDALIQRFADPWREGCLDDLYQSDTVLFKLGYREAHYLLPQTPDGKRTVYQAFVDGVWT